MGCGEHIGKGYLQFITIFNFLLLSTECAFEEQLLPVTTTNYSNKIFINIRVKIKALAKSLLHFYPMGFPVLEHSVANHWNCVPGATIFLLYRARFLFKHNQ